MPNMKDKRLIIRLGYIIDQCRQPWPIIVSEYLVFLKPVLSRVKIAHLGNF
jgi:hypothetical protein